MIKFRCPNCQTKLGVPDEYVGIWITRARDAARKYYPAVSGLMRQCKLLKILENPKKTFIFAMLMTVGFLDLAWVMIGLTAAYITASLEL